MYSVHVPRQENSSLIHYIVMAMQMQMATDIDNQDNATFHTFHFLRGAAFDFEQYKIDYNNN